jgi:virginiamycin B lyase
VAKNRSKKGEKMNRSRGLRFSILTALALLFLLSGGLMPLELQANGGPATLTIWGIPTPNSLPLGVAVNQANGQVYFAETGGDKIGRLDPASNVIVEWTVGDGPAYLEIEPSSGLVYFTEYDGNRISRLSPTLNGYSYATIPTTNSAPNGLKLNLVSPTEIFFTERLGKKVGRLVTGGLVFDLILTSMPTERVVAPTTQTLTPTTTVVTPLVRPGSPGLPPAVALIPGAASGPFTEWPFTLTEGNPAMIAQGPDGRLWISTETRSILQFIPESNIFYFHDLPSESASLDLALDGSGNIWFTEGWADKIGRLNPSNGDVTEWPLPSGRQPFAIAVGPDGTIWFSEREGDRIGNLDPATNRITEYQLVSNAHPLDIAFDSSGNLWFTTERANYLGRLTLGPILGPSPVGLPSVQISIDRGCGANYNPGEPLTFSYSVSETAAVTLLDFETSGNIKQMALGTVPAGMTRSSTGIVGGPAGVETLVLVARTLSGIYVSTGCSFGISGMSPSLVSITVDRGCNGTYHLGETASVTLQSSVSGQVRLYNVTRDGRLVQIPVFPPLITPGLRLTVSAPFSGAIGRNTLVMQVVTGSGVLTAACSTNVLP